MIFIKKKITDIIDQRLAFKHEQTHTVSYKRHRNDKGKSNSNGKSYGIIFLQNSKGNGF